jgi:hypothetical protein
MPVGLGGVCPAILAGLEQVDKINDPQLKRATKNGFLEMTGSPLNDPSLEIKNYDQKDGHRVDVRVKYLKRPTPADVSRSKNYCADGTERPYFEENVVVDKYSQYVITLTDETLQTYCSSASDPASLANSSLNRELLKRIMMAMDALRTDQNDQLLSLMATNFSPKPNSGAGATSARLLGSYSSGSNFVNSPGWDGINEILHQYGTASLEGRPLFVGNGNLDKYMRSMGVACCNEVGFDLTKLNGTMSYFQDVRFGSAVGNANYFGVFAPGTVQMVNFVENRLRQLNGKVLGGIEYGVIPDPMVPGLFWDMQVRWDCEKQWQITLSTTSGLFVEPSDVFAYGDVQHATNYGNVAIRGAWLYNGVGN